MAAACAAWPRDVDVVYLNGAVCGRLLPALPAGGARRVLHVHDIVPRVPRFWRRADVVLAASGAVADRPRRAAPHSRLRAGRARPAAGVTPRGRRDGPGGRVRRPDRAAQGPARPGPRRRPRSAARVPAARVVVVGDDPYGTDPAYTRAVHRARPRSSTYPWSANAPGLMRHLDVLVLPVLRGAVRHRARRGDGGRARRSSRPASAGLPEVVDDGVTGRLVAPGDPDRLAAAVLDVLAHRDSDGRRREGGRARFDADRYAERVERLIADEGRLRQPAGQGPARHRPLRPLPAARPCADTGRGEIVETHDPRRCDVFHSPWIDGALLRSPGADGRHAP